jgi:Ca2+:H+ antiporter
MPEVNVWSACIGIIATIAMVAVTAEMLVETIEGVREHISDEWFGLVMLPLVSFAADGTVATVFFIRYSFALFFGRPSPPAQLAKGRAIDMSIQFTIFWQILLSHLPFLRVLIVFPRLPFFVLIGWWTDKPMMMLFDLYEVTLLLGACFLVNTVTADAKTNWVEGVTLVGLYVLIATASWWYPGQESARMMLNCGSVLAEEGEELARRLFA